MRSPVMFDALEGRRLLSVSTFADNSSGGDDFTTLAAGNLAKGVLSVPGTSGADKITVNADGTDKIAVTLNGSKTTYERSKVRVLLVAGVAGKDEITVDLSGRLGAGLKVTLSGGADDDTIKTNVPAYIDAGAGNDVVTGSAGHDRIVGGLGNDVLTSGGSNDLLYDLDGTNTLNYANGNVDLGAIKLRRSAGGLTIFGTSVNDRFTFARDGTTGSMIRVTVDSGVSPNSSTVTTTFDLSKIRALKLEGGAGTDTAIVPNGLFGNVPFSKRSINA